ncbi:MAG: hypothetical protein RLZZ618_4241 [Pseudomonadota bacterium]|jgi:hypothetical protein
MPITEIANKYLEVLHNGEEPDGGLSFKKALGQSRLDYSIESLSRVDALLDQIRTRLRPAYNEFISHQANVNFLYVLAFYIGKVVAIETHSRIEWYGYDEMIALIPSNRDFFPNCFGTSVTCILSGGTKKGGFFVPLAAVETRLYDDVPDKSVAFSAGAFM